MKLEDIKDILEDTGLPVAYNAFDENDTPALPFIVYREISTDNFAADNKVWAKFLRIKIDLITERRDSATEKKLEDAFSDNDIFWQREPYYEGNEHYTRITYEIEV